MMTEKSGQKQALEMNEWMHAVRLQTGQEPEGLVYESIETPQPGTGEVLVRVHAAAITRDELSWMGERLPGVPSYEFSGVVAAVGPGVDGVAVGEPVYAYGDYHRDGAAAEYTVIQAAFLAPKPRTLSYIESAAVPLSALSAWQGLLLHGGLAEGQRVLIHGAAGGVGAFAVQIAHQCGAYVIATTREQNHALVRLLGADVVVDPAKTPFEDAAGAVDLVFDTVSGDRLERSFAVVRPGGRIVSVASEPSQEAASARGVQAVYFVVEPNRYQLIELANLADAGKLRPVIDSVYPLAQAREAFERSMGAHGPGKIVLEVVHTDTAPLGEH